MNKFIIKIQSVLALLFIGSYTLFAQGGGIPPAQGPIDGGITALAVAASAYIGKKLYDRKK